ncbi:MAG: hypothetical protein ACYS3N_16790, partial [Planctomycetota bacterium]
MGLNWLCFGFDTLDIGPKLALIGFELGLFWLCFLTHQSVKIYVSHCYESGYVHFFISKIGFVLHNLCIWKYVIIERVPKVPEMPKVTKVSV